MGKIQALFWDVGGVLLSNAWDHTERDLAIEHFLLSKPEFEERHTELVVPFEEGRLSLDEYLERTVFYQSQTFSREEFKQFMFSLSRPKVQSLELARSLSSKCEYAMATINNESRDLNKYRIQKFELAEIFDVFVSSCFVGIRKPDERIYRLALELTQFSAEECVFIDDRQENLTGAEKVGIRTVLMKDAQQLRRDLQSLGIEA
jgi:putative hydrolase of the HAD superfamily